MKKNSVPRFQHIDHEPTFDQNDNAPLVAILKVATFPLIAPIKLGKAVADAVLRQAQNRQDYRDNGS